MWLGSISKAKTITTTVRIFITLCASFSWSRWRVSFEYDPLSLRRSRPILSEQKVEVRCAFKRCTRGGIRAREKRTRGTKTRGEVVSNQVSLCAFSRAPCHKFSGFSGRLGGRLDERTEEGRKKRGMDGLTDRQTVGRAEELTNRVNNQLHRSSTLYTRVQWWITGRHTAEGRSKWYNRQRSALFCGNILGTQYQQRSSPKRQCMATPELMQKPKLCQ